MEVNLVVPVAVITQNIGVLVQFFCDEEDGSTAPFSSWFEEYMESD